MGKEGAVGQLGIDGFDAEAYWATREFKKWVVCLTKGNGKKAQRDYIIVQARTEEKAIKCAKRHTMLKGNVGAFAWLARPGDLGCRPVGGGQ
jgi:hypothetical protein